MGWYNPDRAFPRGAAIFRRDRFTLLAYGATAYGVFASAALGPAMPFLRADLEISYTAAGLHFTLLAVGSILAGASTDRALDRFGRRSVFWVAGAGLAVAGGLLIVARHPLGTITASFMIGLSSAAVLATSQSALALRHGPRRAIAFAEASIMASVGFLVAPTLIGSLDGLGLDWRLALLVPAAVWPATFFWQRAVPFPASQELAPATDEATGKFPAAYWAYLVSILLSVAVEWTFVAWGASYVVEETGVSEGSAAFVMTSFFLAMLLGRIAVSRLVRRIAPVPVVLGAILVGLAGFFMWWAGGAIPIIAAGAFVAGLGIASLYPMLAALALGAAGSQTDRASARVLLTAGLALLVTPLALAVVADAASLATAYSVTLIGFLLLAAVTTVGYRLDRQRSVPPGAQIANNER